MRGVQRISTTIGFDPLDRTGHIDANIGGGAFVQQHLDDLFGGVVAEQLAQLFLVIGDAVAFDHLDEMLRRVAGKRGLAEMRVGRQKIRWGRADISS